MKKLVILLIAILTAFALVACNAKDDKKDNESDTTKLEDSTEDSKEDSTEDSTEDTTDEGAQGTLDGTLEEIINKIYETADLTDDFRRYVEEGLYFVEVKPDDERIEYFLGKKGLDFEEALASEPQMQPGAYSLVLVRAKEGADIEKMKTDIKENINPMKWICVGVKEENVIVDNIGNIIILIMSDDAAQPLHEAFLALGNK